MLEIHIKPVTLFAQNCHLLVCSQSKKAALVDPGGDAAILIEWVKTFDCTIEKILLTHGHLDHIGAAEELRQHYQVEIEGPQKEDDFWIESLDQQANMFGLHHTGIPKKIQWLDQGDVVKVGEVELQVIHTPGHTPGHVCFYNEQNKVVLVGDVLFSGSIGRSDFPKGSLEELLSSINDKLMTLPLDTTFYPGHGETGTLDYELKHNPYLRA